MTETDATRKPLEMPPRFIPYLDKYRIYKIFKDIVRDLVINLPKDHLKHMKVFLHRRQSSTQDTVRVVLLISSELNLDVKKLVKEMIKDLGVFVITRRCVMDRYEKHDDYVPGCISPVLMSKVTKIMTSRDPVPQAGWLMFDHPCTVREARCLQQDGVLPTVTLYLMPPPTQAIPTVNNHTPARNFFQQDIEGLKFAYKATLKEVYVEPHDDVETISSRCFHAVQACATGAQGPKQGHHVVGAPGVYRVLILGPRGIGCRSQALALAKHFGLVNLTFDELYNEAKEKDDDVGERLRKFGSTMQLRAEIVKRRLLKKDCLDNGWVLTQYPASGMDFENLDNMPTPPNRVIFLNASWETCKARAMSQGVDWCTGKSAPMGSGPRVLPHPDDSETQIDSQLDYYFSEALAELRAGAGITSFELNADLPFDQVQVQIQAAVIAAPAYDIEYSGTHLHNVRID